MAKKKFKYTAIGLTSDQRKTVEQYAEDLGINLGEAIRRIFSYGYHEVAKFYGKELKIDPLIKTKE